MKGFRFRLRLAIVLIWIFEGLISFLRLQDLLGIRRLLLEKWRADLIAASIVDGIFLLRGENLVYCNAVAERMIQGGALEAVQKSKESLMPVEFELVTENHPGLFYLLQSIPLSKHFSKNGVQEILFHQLFKEFRADTLIIAQDVTIVKESGRVKSQFIATLSHEVNTPVTSLTMATRLLRKSVEQIPNPTQRVLIQTCAEDVDRLRIMLADLFSVSQFDFCHFSKGDSRGTSARSG